MNTITILDNKYCRLDPDNSFNINQLRSFLSFKLVGVEYTAAYKNGGWNGITCLLSKKNVFLLGLLNKVIGYFSTRSIEYTIVDNRKKETYNELDISEKLKSLNLVPRDYQLKIVDATLNNEKGIIRACTGSGKTLVAAMITAKFNKPTIVYVIGLNLLEQFHKTFSDIFDEPIGRIGNGVCDIKRITIASVWTIGKALDLKTKDIVADAEDLDEDEIFNGNTKEDIKRAIGQYKIHLLDESHVATTNTINVIFKNISPERIYGLSGTPYKDDNSDLLIEGLLGKKIIDISASELIERGVLVKPFIKFFTVPKMKDVGETYQEVYKNYIVNNQIRNEMILEQTKKLLEKGYAPLMLFRVINHGKILYKLCKDAGIKCSLLYGNDNLDKRLEVIEDFNSGKIDLIIASNIFSTGVDICKISALILAGSTKSSIVCRQSIGRSVRGYPGKKFVAVVDFFNDVKYLKQHSTKRYKIYKSERGFEVSVPKEMLGLIK